PARAGMDPARGSAAAAGAAAGVSGVWRLERGATLHEEGTDFRVWAPNARHVDLVLHEPGGRRVTRALDPAGDGEFAATVPGIRAGARYSFSLDGGPDRADPVSRWQPDGVHGPSA